MNQEPKKLLAFYLRHLTESKIHEKMKPVLILNPPSKMSSTNRGYDRHKTDYYITPQKCISEFLDVWLSDLGKESEPNLISDRPDRAAWLDPCAGGDENNQMSYPAALNQAFEPESITTLDVREDSGAEIKGDFLEMNPADFEPFDVVITNPPFYLAREIIEHSFKFVKEGGYIVMLLRLNFFGSISRKDFFDKYPPKSVYVHHRRMSFTADGKTDSIEYMHAVWQKGFTPEFTQLKVI